jgi:arylformamidase
VKSSSKIWDISPPIDEHAAVFPGDTSYSQKLHFTLGPNCPVNVHSIALSPHVGAHADAPLHYAAGERTSGALDLQPYIGPCRVIFAQGFDRPGGSDPLITPAHIAHGLAGDVPPRILVRTRALATQSWDSFAAFSADTLDALAQCGVCLVGIDTPSVDPANSQDLPSHQALLRHDMRVLENLVLDEVAEGDYELIALPLKLMKSDASPVRAILRAL